MQSVNLGAKPDGDRDNRRFGWLANVVSEIRSVPVRTIGLIVGTAMVATAVVSLPFSGYPGLGAYPGLARLQVFGVVVGLGVFWVANAWPRSVGSVRVATFLAALVLATGGFVMLAVDEKPVLCPDCENPFREFEPCLPDPNPKKLPPGEFRTLGGCL